MTIEEAIQVYVARHGAYNWEMHEILREAERVRPLDTVLEVGVHQGDSLRVWRAAWDPSLMVGIDPSDEIEKARGTGALLLKESSQAESTHARVFEALDGGRRGVDFLYLDGDHTYEPVQRDWELYAPLVRKGGIAVVHDAVITWNNTVDTHRLYDELRRRYRSKLIFGGGNPEDPGCPTTGAAVFYL